MSWEVFKWYVLSYTSAPRRARNIYMILTAKASCMLIRAHTSPTSRIQILVRASTQVALFIKSENLTKTQLLPYRHLTRGLKYKLLVDGRVIIPPPTTLPDGSNPEFIARSSTGN
jgi:hypothetical protein